MNQIFTLFFNKHPDVSFDELAQIHEATRLHIQLEGKSLHDVSNLKYKDVYTTAKQMEIPYNHSIPVPHLRRMIIEKYKKVFFTEEEKERDIASNEYIQAPLVLGSPLDICTNDEYDFTECLPDCDIEFHEDNNAIPKESSIEDFLFPMMREIYKTTYKCLKYYKGRYYRYKNENERWVLIESLEEVTKELFIVVRDNTRTMNNDFEKIYRFIDSNDKYKQKLRKKLLKMMETTVKTHSTILDMSNKKRKNNNNEETQTKFTRQL